MDGAWVYFNHPENPVAMAIQVVDIDRHAMPVKELLDLGFKESANYPGSYIYEIDRTDDYGQPYVSKLWAG